MRTEMTKGVGFDKFWDDGGGEFNKHKLIHNSHSSLLSTSLPLHSSDQYFCNLKDEREYIPTKYLEILGSATVYESDSRFFMF